MASNLNPKPALHEGPDSGTPVINYVGPAEITTFPTPAPFSPASPPADNKALGWAKRVAFVLLGALVGTLIYSSLILSGYWFSLLLIPLILAVWLGGAYALRQIRPYVQWGVIAVVFTWEIVSSLSLGLLNNNYGHEVYLVVATGSALLAGFAVIKSLAGWRAAFGLLLVAATAVGAWMSQYRIAPTLDEAEFNRMSDIHSWGFVMSFAPPFLLILLYLWSRRQQPNPLLPNGKPQS